MNDTIKNTDEHVDEYETEYLCWIMEQKTGNDFSGETERKRLLEGAD